MAKLYCETCKTTKNEVEFYTSNNKEKYPPNGKLTECKDCITRHVDNWEPETFIPILEKLDLPYWPSKWRQMIDRYCQDPATVTGKTVLGHYISSLKIKQYKHLRFNDTEALIEKDKKEMAQALEGREGDLIPEEIQKMIEDRGKLPEKPPGVAPPPGDAILTGAYQANANLTANQLEESQFDYFGVNSEDQEINEQLTDDDRTYLRLKWGGVYKPSELVRLEQLYNEMMESYDIQSAGHIDTLKLICKTSLKANQLIDLGD